MGARVLDLGSEEQFPDGGSSWYFCVIGEFRFLSFTTCAGKTFVKVGSPLTRALYSVVIATMTRLIRPAVGTCYQPPQLTVNICANLLNVHVDPLSSSYGSNTDHCVNTTHLLLCPLQDAH